MIGKGLGSTAPVGAAASRVVKAHPLPRGSTIYIGHGRFVTFAPTYVVDRAAKPYRRLSATLLLARGEAVRLEVGDGVELSTHAALIAPHALRRRVIAVDSDLAIIDLPIGTPELTSLNRILQGDPLRLMEFSHFQHLVPELARGAAAMLSCDEVAALCRAAVEAIPGYTRPRPERDARVEKIVRLVAKLPLDEVKVAALARTVGLSPSRLRHRFKEKTGSTVTHYARWAALWRAISLWSPARSFTELAHIAGFHDLAHLDRAFIEVFGVSPSTLTADRNVTLIRCPEMGAVT